MPFTNFWVMVQANCLHKNLNSKVLWMVKKLQLSTDLMKLGTVFLDRLLQHIKNVRLIQLHFIYHFLKTFKKFFFQNTPNKKDGILYILSGSILLLVVWKDLFTLMLRVKNGYRLTLEPHMLLWRFLNNKEEFLKLKKQKRKVNHILKFIWINKHLKLKENMQLENSYNTYRFISLLLTSREVLPISINTYK